MIKKIILDFLSLPLPFKNKWIVVDRDSMSPPIKAITKSNHELAPKSILL